MLARSPIVRHWSDMWTSVVPRSRIGVGVTRRHLLAVALTLGIGVLVVLYLHLVGQIALLNYQTELLQARKQHLLEENAHLEARLGPYFSVGYIAERSESFDPIRSSRVSPGPPPGTVREEVTSARNSEGSHIKEWMAALHIDHRPPGFTYVFDR